MKTLLTFRAILAGTIATAAFSTVEAAPFTAGNVAVYRVGDGTTALSGIAAPVFIDEYTPGGALVQSIPMPTTASGGSAALLATGSSTTEGQLNLSADGAYLTFGGYSTTVGTAVPGNSSTIPRTIGLLNAAGVIDTTTTTTAFPTGNVRGVTSSNGTDIWLSGSANGVIYTTKGASGAGTIVASSSTNNRDVAVFGGQLYVSSGAGSIRLATVGSGLPTTTGQTVTNLPGLPTTNVSYNEFAFLDLDATVPGFDTLYVASDGAGAGNFGIDKYSLVGTSWVLNGNIATANARGLAASAVGSTVNLFTTTGTALFSYIDTAGYNLAPNGALTSIATAGTNTAFRGVEFTPVPEPQAALYVVSGLGMLGLLRRRTFRR